MLNLTVLPPALWWFLAGAILLTLEIAAPGVFLLWFGAAAVAVAGLLLVVALPVEQQFLVFAALAVVLVLFARLFLRYGVSVSSQGTLNQRGQRYVGQTVAVTEAITNGRGKVQVGDTLWNAEGPDSSAGTLVRIIGIDGTTLRIERS
jgi:inner membrane protein